MSRESQWDGPVTHGVSRPRVPGDDRSPRIDRDARLRTRGRRSACGRLIRILNVVDDATRECLAAIPDTSISGNRVARERATLIALRRRRGMIVCDHGTEFASNAILSCASENGVDWHCIAPGKLVRNRFCESFNGRVRDDLG